MAKKQKEVVLYDSDWYYENENSTQDEYDYDWEDFEQNLKYACQEHKYETGFICIGSVGTWRGRFLGYYKNVSFNDELPEVIRTLVSNYDRVKIYFNTHGDLELALGHHDGTNYVTIRQLKERYHDENYWDKILTDLYNQDDSSAYKYTKSVKYIFKGWI